MSRRMGIGLAIVLLVISLVGFVPAVKGSAEYSENSSITLKNIILPAGNFTVFAQWGELNQSKTFASDGKSPLHLKIEFPVANIRKLINISIKDKNGSQVVMLSLTPCLEGYRFSSISTMENVEVHDTEILEVSEIVSTVIARIRISGLSQPIEKVNLNVGKEVITPLIQHEGDSVIIATSAIVIDPGAELKINLTIEKPPLEFQGSIVLVGDKLYAGGSVIGSAVEATMTTEHTIALTTFEARMPALGPAFEKVLDRQVTEVIIRKGVPSSAEIYVIVKDLDGNPIASATVEVTGVGSPMKGLTNEMGIARFTIANVTDSRTVNITVLKEGYEKAEKSISILSTLNTVEIVLEKKKTITDVALAYIKICAQYFLLLLLAGLILLLFGALKLKKALVVLGLIFIGLAIASILA